MKTIIGSIKWSVLSKIFDLWPSLTGKSTTQILLKFYEAKSSITASSNYFRKTIFVEILVKMIHFQEPQTIIHISETGVIIIFFKDLPCRLGGFLLFPSGLLWLFAFVLVALSGFLPAALSAQQLPFVFSFDPALIFKALLLEAMKNPDFLKILRFLNSSIKTRSYFFGHPERSRREAFCHLIWSYSAFVEHFRHQLQFQTFKTNYFKFKQRHLHL